MQLTSAPMYVPFIASLGVLNPSPTSFTHRLSFVTVFFTPLIFAFWKIACFWKAFSIYMHTFASYNIISYRIESNGVQNLCVVASSNEFDD